MRGSRSNRKRFRKGWNARAGLYTVSEACGCCSKATVSVSASHLMGVTENVHERASDRPGELVVIDVMTPGQISDGGSWRVRGRSGHHGTGEGYNKLHIPMNNRTRRALVSAHPYERGGTCVALLKDAIDGFATNGVSVERVMTGNALNSSLSREFRDALDACNVRHLRTRPFRPQPN